MSVRKQVFEIFLTCRTCEETKHRKFFEIRGNTRSAIHKCGTRRASKQCHACKMKQQKAYNDQPWRKIRNRELDLKHNPRLTYHIEGRDEKNQRFVKGVKPANRQMPYDYCPLYKTCSECNVEKYYKEFYLTNTTLQGTRTLGKRCRSCKRKYEFNRRETFSQEKKDRINRNAREKNKNWIQKNKAWEKERRSNWNKKQREELTDLYVKKALYPSGGCKGIEIPQHLIDLKREVLKLNRLINKLK